MMNTALAIFTSLTCLFCSAWAQAPETSAFEQGIKNFREKKFEEASQFFSEAFHKEPDNVAALINKANAEFNLGRYGWAIALARRAVTLDPENDAANRAVEHLSAQIQSPDITKEIELFESIRNELLVPIPLWVAFAAMLMMFTFGGYLLLRYFGVRKKALKTEQVLPPFPSVGALLAIGWLFFSFVFWAKVYDHNRARVTVVSEKSAVLAGPGEDQLLLFDAPAGVEFILKGVQGDWALVKYPGGLSGWTLKKNLFTTSGPALENFELEQ